MRMFRFFLPILISCAALAAGCGGGDGDSSPKATAPAVTVDLAGTLTVPAKVNSDLLANLLDNTDRQVRDVFASAGVLVNGATPASLTIQPSSVSTAWSISLKGIPQSSSGLYKVELAAKRLILRAWVLEAGRTAFTLDSRSTAAALLAERSGLAADALVATFPSLVDRIAREIENGYGLTPAEVGTNVLTYASLTYEVARQGDFLKENTGFDPAAKVAYLDRRNDLDGDGNVDLEVVPTTDGLRVRFLTQLSSQTTMMDGIAALASYSDARLLSDFRFGATSNERTFDSSARNTALGLFFKRSARSDVYLKLFLKRIDLTQGTFKGVVAEYSYATATSTAIASGTKILRRRGSDFRNGTVMATDFLTDDGTAANILQYLNRTSGLGSYDRSVRLVRAVQGQPALSLVTAAEKYLDAGANYFLDTFDALQGIYIENRGPVAGDVFTAYFPGTRHYALFKVKAIDDDTITLDYLVNSAPDEPRFQ